MRDCRPSGRMEMTPQIRLAVMLSRRQLVPGERAAPCCRSAMPRDRRARRAGAIATRMRPGGAAPREVVRCGRIVRSRAALTSASASVCCSAERDAFEAPPPAVMRRHVRRILGDPARCDPADRRQRHLGCRRDEPEQDGAAPDCPALERRSATAAGSGAVRTQDDRRRGRTQSVQPVLQLPRTRQTDRTVPSAASNAFPASPAPS